MGQAHGEEANAEQQTEKKTNMKMVDILKKYKIDGKRKR